MKKLLILGFAVALACAAYAYPTFTGQTGLISVPTAAVAPTGQIQVAADWFYTFADTDAIYPVRVLYGVNNQLEIGAAYMGMESSSDHAWDINAKYVLPLTFGQAQWALGASYTDGDNIDAIFGASLAATRAFNETFKGTASLMWNDRDGAFLADIEGFGSENQLALALGGEANFDNGLSLVGEYINFLPGAEINMAARYALTSALTAQAGFVFNTSSPFIGVSYNFGGAAAE